jgi:hypothetical protein
MLFCFWLLAVIHRPCLIYLIFVALHCKSSFLWNYLIWFRVLLLNILLSVAKHNSIHCVLMLTAAHGVKIHFCIFCSWKHIGELRIIINEKKHFCIQLPPAIYLN